MKNKEVQGGKIKPIHIILFGVSAVAVMAIVTIVVLWLGGTNDLPMPDAPSRPAIEAPATGGRGTVINEQNVDEIREQLNRPVDDAYYETYMNVNWLFPDPSGPSSNAFVENSTNNSRTVYFDLILADSKELIYSSPFIPVGARLDKFELDAELPEGVYGAIVVYHLVDDDHQEITTVSVAVTLHLG